MLPTEKLSGMSENTITVRCNNRLLAAQQIVNALNVSPLAQSKGENVYRFSARVLGKDSPLLIELNQTPEENGKKRCVAPTTFAKR